MAAIYCATQKYTVNSGLGIYNLAGSTRPSTAIHAFRSKVSNAAGTIIGDAKDMRFEGPVSGWTVAPTGRSPMAGDKTSVNYTLTFVHFANRKLILITSASQIAQSGIPA